MKKINMFFIVLCMLFVFTTRIFAYTSDELDAANFLAQELIIVAHDNEPEAYNLDENVLRQEIAAVALGVSGYDKKATCDGIFRDINSIKPNNWACYTVEQLADSGFIALNNNFRPEDYISKTEALGMITKSVYGNDYKFDENSILTWQDQIVNYGVEMGFVDRFSDYDAKATRGFVFEVAHKAKERSNNLGINLGGIGSALGLYDTLEFEPIVGSSSNFIPFPSENVLFIDFQIKNPTNEDIYITEIHANIINSEGLGIGEFSNLKLYKDDVVMTFANTFDFTDVNTIIKAGEAAVFMIRGNISEYVLDQTTFDLEIAGTDIKAFHINGEEIFFTDGAVMSKKFILYKNEKQPKDKN